MRWLGGDLRWLVETLRSPPRPDVEPKLHAVWLFASEFLRAPRYDYLSLRDPIPALAAVAGLVGRVPAAARRGAAPPPGGGCASRAEVGR
jgi:hypothetical protein